MASNPDSINGMPPSGTQIIDQRGLVSPPWYRWFVSLRRGAVKATGGEVSTLPGSGLQGGGLVQDGVDLSIAPDGVTDAMLRPSLGCSVMGRFVNSTGNPADIQATANNRVLGRFGDQLVFKDVSLIPATVGDGDYGDITVSGSGATWTIDNGVVSNAKLANVPTATFKGRVTAGTGAPEDLTGTQATTLLDAFTSALKGLAPASGGGTVNYLRADGTWASPPGAGSVTTVSVVTANGVSGSVANPTSTPAITLTLGAITPTSVAATTWIKTTPKTVGTLIAAATAGAGARDFVTDATAPAFGVAVVGGGAVSVPVYSDGANWLVG